MIAGLGTDIIEVERIRQSLQAYGDAFKQRIFTDSELAEAAVKKDPSVYFAGRWAAKEAVSKALGTGIGSRCSWQDICVLNGKDGKPEAVLSGLAKETADSMNFVRLLISISHERNLATAVAILES